MSALALLRKTSASEYEFLGFVDRKVTREAEANIAQQVGEHRLRAERAQSLQSRAMRAAKRADDLWAKRRRAILGQRPRRIHVLTIAHQQATYEFQDCLFELRDFAVSLSAQLADERMKP